MIKIFRKAQIKYLLSRGQQHISQSQSDEVFSKLSICREQRNLTSLFVKNSETLAEFKQTLHELFPDRDIFISTFGMWEKDKKVNKAEAEVAFENVKDAYVIDALILNRLNVFEELDNGMQLCYGLQILEYNMSNNVHISENIEEGIAELNATWRVGMPISEALSFEGIRSLNDGVDEPKAKSRNLTIEEEQSLNESLGKLVQLQDFKKLKGITSPSSSQFMKRIISLMTVQWIFLFAVTYGKYGWDVGEPLSYLSSLGVDLTAMLGIFQLEANLQKNLEDNHQFMSAMLNLPSMYRMTQWRISYFKRKLSA